MLPPTKRRRSEPRAFQPRAVAFTIAIAIAVNTLAYIAAGAESTTCGGDLTDSYGVVLSPGYPETYPPDASCLWHIAPNVTHTNGTNNGLTLTFTKFQTQPDVGTSGMSGDVETLLVYTSDPNYNTSVVSSLRLELCRCFVNRCCCYCCCRRCFVVFVVIMYYCYDGIPPPPPPPPSSPLPPFSCPLG